MMMDISYKLDFCRPRTSADGTSPVIATPGSARPPRLPDIDPRDNFLGRLRSERRQHFTSVQDFESWTTMGDSWSADRSIEEENKIHRDVQWTVEASYA